MIRLVVEHFPDEQRARDTSGAACRVNSLPAALSRQAPYVLRLNADPALQCQRAAEEPVLRGRIRLQQKREAYHGGGLTGAQVLRPRQAARGLGAGARAARSRCERGGGGRALRARALTRRDRAALAPAPPRGRRSGRRDARPHSVGMSAAAPAGA
jgi:hypothetical protein